MSNYSQKVKINNQQWQFILLLLFILVILGWGIWDKKIDKVILPVETNTNNSEETIPNTEFLSLAAANPKCLSMPAHGLKANFVGAVGLNPDGSLEVPESFTEIAWYKYGPTPGELGPAVVVGHVDSYQGPAVFYPLRQASIGDSIYVDRDDGTTAEFVVTDIKTYDQNNFATPEVYSDLPYAGLRLITCTGVYDHNTLRYSHNLVVFARLIGVKESLESN